MVDEEVVQEGNLVPDVGAAVLAAVDPPGLASVPPASFGRGPKVFRLVGTFDRSRVSVMRQQLIGAIGEPSVCLDLAGVQFMDNVATGALLAVVQGIQGQGGLVTITGADPRRGIAGALKAAGIDAGVLTAPPALAQGAGG